MQKQTTRDPLEAWLVATFKRSEGGIIPVSELFEDFHEWIESKGFTANQMKGELWKPSESVRAFAIALCSRPEWNLRRHRTSKFRGIVGLQFRKPKPKVEDDLPEFEMDELGF